MAIEARYQTVWRRIWAGLFDFLFLFPLLGVQFALMDSALSPRSKLGLHLLFVFCGLAYKVVLHWRLGATLGKQVVGIRVVDISGQALTLRQALLRELWDLVQTGYSMFLTMSALAVGKSPPSDEKFSSWIAGAFVAIEFATIFSSSKRRAPHDFIAGTVVVVEPPGVFVKA